MSARQSRQRPGAVTMPEVSAVAAHIAAEVAGLAKQAARCDQKAIVGMVMTMVARDLNRAIPGAALRMGVGATLAMSESQPQMPTEDGLRAFPLSPDDNPQAAPQSGEGEFAGVINDVARAWRLRRSIARVQAITDHDT